MIGHSFPTLEEKPYIPTMPKNRIFSVVVLVVLALVAFRALAQAPAPTGGGIAAPAAEPPTPAELALDEAIKKVAALSAVSANLEQHVVMLKQDFRIKGSYKKAPGDRLRTQLDVLGDSGLPDATGTMLQVCDGDWLWEYQKVLESQNFRKMKIGRILEKLKSAELDDAFREQVLTQLGFAGPDILLVGLRKAIQFDQKTAATLPNPNSTARVIDDKKADQTTTEDSAATPAPAALPGNMQPMWLLTGTWKSREGLLGPNQQPLPPTAPLPAYVPSLAKVWIGQNDGWPYRVELIGRIASIVQQFEDTRKAGPDGRVIGVKNANNIQKVEPTKIILIYENVELNPKIGPEEFAFTAPPDAKVDDNTEAILNGLEQAVQMKAAQKKTEAAKGETLKSEPVLTQPIEVPKPAPPPASPK